MIFLYISGQSAEMVIEY
ncbi:UNVERIFIED_CONTAM: hypothetical protein GTU68_028309 [Idotea baltica]|nr:hypothetical protein [Idotea baltica]